ncbi:MAG: phosphatidylserine/phosphatidylglycerophosphate/cardiolipin synthase family protein [Candidatus Paceibacterota bacterium]
MPYKFFSNSYKTWQAMFEEISFAKKSIYLEMYIFQDDITDFNFFNLLKEKAKAGLRVKIILDSFGSSGLSKNSIIELRESGIELIFLSYFLYRTHRKILIVDEKIAFIGGVNFHKNSLLWNDLMVRVKGKLVFSINKSFARVYFNCGGKDPLVLLYNQKNLKTKMKDWLIEHFPINNKFNLKNIYKEHLLGAKNNIILCTPYFMPKRWLIGALHQAHLRGVRVEILIPKDTDHYFIDRLNYFFINKVYKLGINVFFENKMNHSKIMIIDNKEAIVGSNNLDYLSFEMNSEVGIFFNNKVPINQILNVINGWKKETTYFNNKIYKMKFFDYILYPFISMFFRIL